MTEVLIYAPFLVSALALLPKGSWIAKRKVEDLSLPDKKEEETAKTLDLVMRFSQVYRMAIFNSLYGDLAILSTLISSTASLAKASVISLIVTLVAYHALLGLATVRFLIDYNAINIYNVDDRYLWIFTAKSYLVALSIFLTLVPAAITGSARYLLL